MKTSTKNKTLFVIHCDHAIDIITNSSSELFVLEAKSEEIVEEMISSAYPDYLTEYRKPIKLRDCDDNQLETYIDYKFCVYKNKLIPGFTMEEQYEPKNEHGWVWLKEGFVKNNRERILAALDPNDNVWMLFSMGDNPNFEFQEKLEEIGTRYHLG